MVYTFLQLKQAAQHAIAGSVDGDAFRMTDGQVVNAAMAFLYQSHEWSWRLKVATLDLVNATPTVVLPADFGELVVVNGTGVLPNLSCRRVGYAEYLNMLNPQPAGNSTFTPFGLNLGYTVIGKTQASTSVAGTSVLGIAPAPDASYSGALSIFYNRTVPTFSATGTSDDAKVFDVPEKVHDVLMMLCRAMAVSAADQQEGEDWRIASQALSVAIKADQRVEGEHDGASSQQRFTFGFYKSMASTVLGKRASRHNLGRIVNDAYVQIMSAHRWKWNNTLQEVFGENTTELGSPVPTPVTVCRVPLGGNYITACRACDGTPVRFLNHQEWMQMVLRRATPCGEYVACIRGGGNQYPDLAGPPSPNASSQPTLTMVVYPAPETPETFGFMCHQQSALVQLRREFDVPGLPEGFQTLMGYCVRMLSDDLRLKPTGQYNLRYEALLKDLIEADAGLVPGEAEAHLVSTLPGVRSDRVGYGFFDPSRHTVDYTP